MPLPTAFSRPARHSVLLYDAQQQQWLYFQQPTSILVAQTCDAVMPLLQAVQQAVDAGHYAAGFLSYEASPAFDAGFAVQPCDDFPLAWFGLYAEPQPVTLPEVPNAHIDPLTWVPDISRDRYQQSIQQIKAAIAEGRTYQVNYSFRLRSALEGDPFAYFLRLIHAQKAQYSAFVDLGDWAICCASPELFFEWQAGVLTSRPMKGTAARGLTYASDRAIAQALRHSEKNQAENLMIVDMIRNDMGRIAQTGTVEVPRLFDIEQYPTLWQMTSPVRCQTSVALPDLFQALFPCASITGAPKHSTMQIIQTLETSPRRIYTGTLGFVSPHRTAQFNVAIRTVLVNQRTATAEYGVGGGIVWDSDATDEYTECCTKSQILTQSQPGFALLETLLWEPDRGYFLLDLHVQRLQQSAEYFGFSINLDAVRSHLNQVFHPTVEGVPHKLRLTVSASGELQSQFTAIAPPAKHPIRLRLSPIPIDSNHVFLYHKTTHRLVYDTARQSLLTADDALADDVLLWNERGEVTESCIANLVVELEGQRYTPPIACGLLAGTYRRWLLEQGTLQERVIHLNELSQCTRLWTINSVRKWQTATLLPASYTSCVERNVERNVERTP
jgi:para-aminobenzoate synthetase / 4-amino-4-deoxychorismate lyase